VSEYDNAMIGRSEPDGTAPLHRAIARQLGIEIMDGIWAADQVLTLEDIQARFDVSRTVAREVSRLLESMRLVQTRRRIGLAVRPQADWNVLDPRVIDWRLNSAQRTAALRSLTELRMVVEPAAAAGAARYASVRDRATFVPLAAELRRSGESGQLAEFLELDIAFHRLILSCSGNELFAALSGLVAVVLSWRTERGLMPANPKPEALDGHEAVAEAIWRGQPEAAWAAMEAIVAEVRTAMGDT
jgi:DNA-binding FadR family transcriptional regulator